MNPLRLFLSDQTITRKNLLVAIAVLSWFGMAVNGLYDLWRLIPTLFMKGPLVPDRWGLLLYLLPIVSFLVFFILYLYPGIQERMKLGSREPGTVTPHKGVILALSKPNKPPEQIIETILNSNGPSELYSERSIGQLFKGLYHHEALCLVIWPLTTPDSEPYVECIAQFAKRFMPKVKDVCRDRKLCHIDSTESELEVIQMTKAKLLAIYSAENLNTLAINRSDIIVDVTGGTKPITIGLTFGALGSVTDIQYVEQTENRVIPLEITPDIVVDKMGEYLLALSAKLQKIKVCS